MYYDHGSKKIKLMDVDRKCEDIDGNDIDDLWQSLYSYKTCCHNVWNVKVIQKIWTQKSEKLKMVKQSYHQNIVVKNQDL